MGLLRSGGLKEVGMRSMWMRRLGLVALAAGPVLFSALTTGCAQERDPINRVQANALDKSFFVGANLSDASDDPEFYMRNTVVDVPYGAAQEGLFTASYAQPLSRIKWEITENALVGRQTYEHIQDSDHNGSKATNTGQVVAMFNIQSHFDIRRSYNTQTGEENNVVEENTTDRPWFQRQFFRVDWSKNLVTDGYEVDTLSQLGVFGGVKFDPMAYFVEDPTSPDAPVFVQNEGYFDVTTKAFATPQLVKAPWNPNEQVPACFFPGEYGGSAPIANCNPTEVTLRLAFRKVVDTDYEAVDQTGPRQEAFGWFTVERYGYERNYGILDERWHRFAAKYNIWQKSHVEGSQCAVDYWRDQDGNVAKYKSDGAGGFITDGATGLPIPDPNGQPFSVQIRDGKVLTTNVHIDNNKDGTEDACEFTDAGGNLVTPGSRCDEFAHKCTMPLHTRKLKTIPWYYGKDAPPDLFTSTAVALDMWNVAVKRAAVLGQMVEANRVHADSSAFMGTDANGNAVPWTEEALAQDNGAAIPHVFVLCHNPVIEGDNKSCGKPGLVARLGDIRYNIVNIINNPQTPSPWGIMVDADDPLTGEKVATSVNEWGHVLDIASQGTEDLLRWINGEIGDNQITSGAYLRDWVNATKLGVTQHVPETLSAKEQQSRLNSIDRTIAKMVQLTPEQQKLPAPLRAKMVADQLAQKLGPSMDSKLEASRNSLIGTKWEAQLATEDWLQAAGMDPKTPVAGNDAVLAKASTLRGMNPRVNALVRRMRDTTMASRASCMIEQPEPDSLVGMARQAARLFPLPNAKDPDYPALKAKRDAALHQWIREQFHISVIAHEMGHSMGLRHNFTGNFDALNFHTEYWQLRTRNGKEHYCVAPDAQTGKQPPWVSKPTGTQVASNTLGLDLTPHLDGSECVGPRWIDPVTDTEVNGLIWKWGSTTVMDYPGDQTQDMNSIGPYDKAAMRFGYADIVDVDTDAKLPKTGPDGNMADKASAYVFAADGFGGIGGRTVGGNHYSTYNDKYNVLGTCSAQTDPNDPLSAKCTGPSLDYVAYRDMKDISWYGDAVTAQYPQFKSVAFIDAQGRARHPYMFGSDEFADFGNVPVFRFDSGADSYEQFEFLISTYENRYIFDNFRRDRPTFNTRSVLNRAMDRYFDKIQGMTKSLALLIPIYTNGTKDPTADPGSLMPLALGAADGLKMFARIITRPEPGGYNVNYPLPKDLGGTDGQMPMPFAQLGDINSILNKTTKFDVALGTGEGRYLHNDYDYTQGYYWSDYQTQVGSAYEKSIATSYLTEAYNHFISNSKEDYLDGRYKNLNYASIYPQQIRRLFTQVLQNDPMTLGPFVSLSQQTGGLASDGRTARVQYLPWEKFDVTDSTTTQLDYMKDAVILDPLIGWEQQYRMLIDLFIYGGTTLTMDFVDQLRIYSPGGVDTISIAPEQQVRYRDPATGIEYVAKNYGTEVFNSRAGYDSAKSMGARMIQYANRLAASVYRLDPINPVDHVTGELNYEKDSVGAPICKGAPSSPEETACIAAGITLKKYSSNLDTVRQLTAIFGYGPL
jgi:hypothetical protein